MRNRTGTARGRLGVAVAAASMVAASVVVSNCSTTDQTAPPETSSSSGSAPASWDIVLIGDSVWLQSKEALQQRLEDELGVELVMHNWINPDIDKYDVGGERSGDLLARLRTDENLRNDIREAEIIGFDVPTGVFLDTCTGDPSTATPAEVQGCLDQALSIYRSDSSAIIDELVALRPPDQAIIRATTVWQFLMPTFSAAGTYDIARPRWQAMNQAMLQAAQQNGITTLPAYDTFSGPDGSRDPVAAGDVDTDELHLTPQGVDRFVDLFLTSGLPKASNP
jgi:hypothetical protein